MKYLLITTDKQGTERVLISHIDENLFLEITEIIKPNGSISYIFTHINLENVNRKLGLGFYTKRVNEIEEIEAIEKEMIQKYKQNYMKYVIDF